ncbi:MAG: hypothetical protein K0S79_2769, partial [Nitrospira sp.]|nr:hypothetical protein [Nitrospira sp.]
MLLSICAVAKALTWWEGRVHAGT